jgi:hypothetical protein
MKKQRFQHFLFSIFFIFSTVILPTAALAVETTDTPEQQQIKNKISDIIQNDKESEVTLQRLREEDHLYQELLKSEDNVTLISGEINYIITEYQADYQNNITEVTSTFDYLPLDYVKELVSEAVSPQAVIAPGQREVKDFSILKVSLGLYDAGVTPVSGQYSLIGTFTWVTLPSPGYLTNIQGAFGLCTASQLAFDSSTAEVMIEYNKKSISQGTYYGHQYIPLNVTLNGFVGDFTVLHQSGQGSYDYCTSFAGRASAKVYKTNMSDVTCSAMASYSKVSATLTEPSISFPVGISFGMGTIHTAYNLQSVLRLV